MNILIFNDYACIQGGAAQVAIASAKGLADAGYNVHYIYAVGPAAEELYHPNIKLLDLRQYDLLSHPSKAKAAVVGVWNTQVSELLNDFLEGFEPQDTVAHFHTWVKSLTSSAVVAVRKKNIPIVLTLHDYFTACPNGGFYNYNASSVCKLDAMSIACLGSNCDSRSYAQKLWRFARQIVTNKSGVPSAITDFIYVSHFSLEILKQYLPTNSSYWHIPNPIDIEKQSQAKPSESDVFTYIGRFSPEKGAQLFALAAQNLGIRARFVGGGELIQQLQEINPTAEFTGWLNRDAIPKVVRNSRAIVFPSYLYETQGMVVAEAAALGIPCIVSDACAGKDYIIDGKTGILFESGDVSALEDAIVKIANSPELADQMGQASYTSYWEKPPTLERHVSDLVNCYNAILARNYTE
ncbi:glycosyltransferase family 4 protein [Pseudomonas sp. NY15372]|uniref:glycosyltransferase family 4 protein n=1 Tax=Pseudomonas sp. NY15372 TaxID=3400356 RepID=UPI003A87B07C